MDAAFLDVVTRGTVLGLAAGFSPGPLTLLVITETLRHGLGAGVRVSLAPLLTDLPLIVLSVLLLERLAAVPAAAGVIALAGAAFLFHLGAGSLRLKDGRSAARPSPRRGRSSRAWSPTSSIPTPTCSGSASERPFCSARSAARGPTPRASPARFSSVSSGSKILLARMVDRSRGFLKGGVYLWTMRVLGILLIVYGCLFLREGLLTMGVWPAGS